MHPNDYPYNIGDEVISVDNRNLGTVIDIHQDRGAPGSLIVDQGRLNQSTLAIPVDMIANATGGVVYLSISEFEANTRSE